MKVGMWVSPYMSGLLYINLCLCSSACHFTPEEILTLDFNFCVGVCSLCSRCSEQGMMPSMNRSMSVPDTGSMWDMHTSASQPSGTF